MGVAGREESLAEYEKSIPMSVRKQIEDSCMRSRLKILREYYEDFNSQLKEYHDPTDTEAGLIERNEVYLVKINLRLNSF